MKKRILSVLLAIVMVVGLMPGVTLTASAAYTGSPVLKTNIVSQETPDDVNINYEFASASWYPVEGTTYKLYTDVDKTTEAGTVVLTADPKLEVTLNEAPTRDTRYYLTATAPNSEESNCTGVVVKAYRITNGFTFSYGEYSDIGYVDFFQNQTTYNIVLPPATAADAPISVEFETANGAAVTYGGDTNLMNGSGSVTATVVSETPAFSYAYTINFTTMKLGGQGTEAEPYLITSAAELKQLADCLNNCGASPMDTDSCGYGNFCGYYFRLTKDIDLTGVEWEPIGHSGSTYFAGHFDGDGHTVSNMTTTGRTAPGEDGTDCSRFNAAGLFGWCAFGSVKNVTVDNADVTAIGQNQMGYAGGLIAVPYGCSVSNCHVKNSTIESGRVPTTNSNFVGGVAGIAAAPSEFEKCSSVNNTVRGTMYVGGFIGSQDYDDSYYTDCYVADTTIESVMVSSSFYCNVGGFASASQAGDYVMTNCFVYDCKTQVADGANANQYEEGILNKYEWSTDVAVTTNCYYYTTQIYEDGTAATAVAKTADEFANGNVLVLLNGDRTGEDAVWMQGESYPVFKVPTYTVTVENGTGDGNYAENATVTITADSPASGKKFAGWTSEDGVTFADSKSAETTFTMPAKAVAVTATYADLLPGKVMVNGVDLVNGDEDHTIACGSGTAVYDPDTQTLTLTDAEITLPSTTSRRAGIYIDKFTSPVTVNLVGANSITLTNTAYDNNGIWNDSSADLKITGTGSLDALTYNDYGPFGIWNQKSDLSVEDAELTFSLASGSASNGYLVDTRAIALDGVKLTASGYLQGLYALDSLTIENQSVVDITAIENALYSGGDISIENSTVTATVTDFAAICVWGDLTITDSDVTAASVWDNGIYCYGTVTVSGGTAEITSEESDAFRSNGGITIMGDAEVTATAAGAAVYTNEILSVESGKLTAEGGNCAILARRISENAEDSKPTDSAVAIVLGEGMIETSGGTIKTEDWTYTEVWDDYDWDYYDKWMSQSYFVDDDGTKLTEANIVAEEPNNDPPVIIAHTCTSKCPVCGGCMDKDCTWYICADKCNGDENVFTDVAGDAWYTEAVKYVYHRGMMEGVGSDLFDPHGTTTRAMIVTILWRMEGEPICGQGKSGTFGDVPEYEWYTEAIEWAASKGIVNGYGDAQQSFGPMDPVTREQLAAILWRFAQYKDYDVSVGEDTNILSYDDAFDISEYAIPAMQWACGEGVITGRGGGILAPCGNASRCEAAAMLMRFDENAAEK